MAVTALVSAKGSPGVTATSLAFTLTWSSRVVLAECDPAGGAVAPGYLQGRLGSGGGLLQLAMNKLRGSSQTDVGVPDAFWGGLVDLSPPDEERLLLPGLTDPAQAATVEPVWMWCAELFARLGHLDRSYDVIADCGRLAAPNTPWPVLARGDAVLLVVEPTLLSATAAVPTIAALRKRRIEQAGSDAGIGLLVVGSGPYRSAEIGQRLGVRVIAELPHDGRTAQALSHGGAVGFGRPLMRASIDAGDRVRRFVAEQQRLAPPALRDR
ncbi:ParA family protein [Cryptosporangium sp. NPDC051539]|uniref:ParA family protein n=1 Tax=Cryptosporangium sp. NPDC051539 TaxID=3363962 RepID=UPI00378953AB